MNCPYCSEKIRFRDVIDSLIMWISQEWHWRRLQKQEQAQEAKNLKELRARFPLSKEKLTERENLVCWERLSGQSYEDIAYDMNVTRERIRQIEAKALRKLRRSEP